MIRRHSGERVAQFLAEIGAVTPNSPTSPKEIHGILENLPERSRRMILMRYGIGTGISWTLQEIGREYGLSRERVREIISKSIRVLRDKCNPDSFLNLGFSAKMIASLKKANIRTIEDLVRKTESELLIIQGFGAKSLETIKIALSGRGLSVGSEPTYGIHYDNF